MADDAKKFGGIKELGYYVYRLIDPRNGETFYVGKGKGNRVFAHVNDAADLLDYAEDDNDKERLLEKLEIIRAIKAENLEVLHIIHRHGMTSKEAFEVEAALIDVYPGLANKVKGHGAGRGPANAEMLILKYDAPTMVIDPNHKIIACKVNHTFHEKGALKAVEGYWEVNPNNANDKDYILAIVDNICKGVFVTDSDGWKPTTPDSENKIKYWFSGDNAPDEIWERYYNKKLPKEHIGQWMTFKYIN